MPFRLEGTRREAVVLVHGFTGIPGHFGPLARHLHGEGFTVNVPLLAGHGTEPGRLQTVDVADWGRSVVHAARAVSDHRRVHLVGLSLGGLLSIITAGEVAAASVTTISSPLVVRNPRLYASGFVHRLMPYVEWPDTAEPVLDPDTAGLAINYSGFPTRAAGQLVRAMRLAYRAARRLRRPALVVQSRADQTVHPASAILLHRALGPDCRLVWLDHSMHNALIDRERDTIHAAVLDRVTT
jgi:carboxylesterase